jgi:hypothetical protein
VPVAQKHGPGSEQQLQNSIGTYGPYCTSLEYEVRSNDWTNCIQISYQNERQTKAAKRERSYAVIQDFLNRKQAENDAKNQAVRNRRNSTTTTNCNIWDKSMRCTTQ